jgi:4-diphosphocytidyl-2C-methyl-D-erythritol kinase
MVETLRSAGAFHAAMSGSGSAVFGLFDRRQGADRAARALAKSGRTLFGAASNGRGSIVVTRTLNRAAYQRLAAFRPIV